MARQQVHCTSKTRESLWLCYAVDNPVLALDNSTALDNPVALDEPVALDKPVPVGWLLHAPQLLRHVESINAGLAVHSPACVHSVHLVDWSAQGAMTGRCLPVVAAVPACDGCGGLGCAAGRIARSCAGDIGSSPGAGVHVSQHSDCMKCGLRTHSPALAHCPHSRLLSAQLASPAAFVASCLRLSSVTSRARDWGWLRAGVKSLIASSSVDVRVSEASRWRPTSNSNSTTALVAAPERRKNGPLDAGRREEKQVVGSSSASLGTWRFSSIPDVLCHDGRVFLQRSRRADLPALPRQALPCMPHGERETAW